MTEWFETVPDEMWSPHKSEAYVEAQKSIKPTPPAEAFVGENGLVDVSVNCIGGEYFRLTPDEARAFAAELIDAAEKCASSV